MSGWNRPSFLVAWRIAATLAAVTDLRAASTGGLLLETAGSITSNQAEVVSGPRSIKGSYSGTNSYTPYLRSDPSRLPLQRNQTYRATFRYKILSTPDKGFEVLFYSPIAGAQNNFLPSQTVFGAAGDTGTVSLTNTLGSFDDYQARWNVIGKGAIAIDDIQITNASTGAVVASEDAEPGTILLSAFFVSTSKPSFVWGEPVKVTAASYDETGKPRTIGNVAWTVAPSTAASVAPDGTVTPRALATFTVRGTAAGASGEVLMQALPKRIVVTPEKTPMLVGSTQKMRANVLDANDQPIPNAAVGWRVSSDFYDFSNSATIDSTGTLKAVMQARVRVVARIQYNQSVPGFDQVSQGDALVEITAPTTYRFERVFVARASGAAASTLAPRAAQLIPTETGGFMFAASLDGLGSALLEWNNDNLTPLLTSGRVNLVNGYPLADFVNYNRTASGDILVQEVDTSGSALVSRGSPGLITPLFASGSAVFGAQSTNSFDVFRNSLAGTGAMVIRVGYNDAVTHLYTSGLFRGFNRGISEPLMNSRDSRIANGDAPGWFDTWGIANDGTAWFESTPGVVWRSRPGQPPEKLISAGDKLGDATVGSYLVNYSPIEELLFVAGNGDVINAVYTDKGQRFLLWHDGDSAPSAVLPANAYGLYWYDAGKGALIDAAFPGKPRGLYQWNSDGAKPLLLLNATSVDGSPVLEILSATNTSDGTIYVMVRTSNNPMVIARLAPDPQVLLQAGDSVPVSVPPVITALIPGARSGIPMVIAGGAAGSIAQLDASGAITPVVPVGAKLPDGKYFAGSRLYEVRTLTDGRIVFGHDYFAQDSSLFTWNQGTIELTVRAPLKHPDGTNIGSARNIEVNRQGDVAFQLGWNGPGLYFLRNGKLTTVADGRSSLTVDGTAFQNPTIRGIDDSGNILFSGTKPDGSGFYYALWDGSAAHIIMTPGQKMPDGRQISSVGAAWGCSDGFAVGTLGTVARYRNGTWDYLTDPSQPLATGAQANTLGVYDVNRPCDVVFTDGVGLGAFAGSQYREIQDLQQLTPDGDLLSVSKMLINDDATIYVLGANDRGEEVLYRGTPLQ